MTTQGTYTVSVKLIDEATKELDKVNKSLIAAQAPALRYQKAMKKNEDLTGITKQRQQAEKAAKDQEIASIASARATQEKFDKHKKALTSFSSSLVSTAKKAAATTLAIAGISGIASIGGVYELAKGFASVGVNLGIMSKHLGMSVQQMQALQNAGQLSGMDPNAAAAGAEELQEKMQNAAAGRDPLARRVFAGIGVDPTDVDPKDIDKNLDKIRSAYKKLDGQPIQQRKLLSLTGTSAFEPMMQESDKDLAADRKKGAENAAYNQPGVDAAQRLNKAFIDLQQTSKGLKSSIMEALEPALTPLIITVRDGVKAFSDWVKANKDLIQTDVKAWLEPISNYIKNTNAKDFATDVKHLGEALAVITLLPVAASFLSMSTAIIGVGRAVGGLLLLSPGLNAALAAAGAVYLAYTRTKEAYDDYEKRKAENQAALDSVAPNPEKQAHFDALGAAHQLPPDLQKHYDDSHRTNGRRGGPDAYAPGTAKTARGPIDLSAYKNNTTDAVGAFGKMGYGKDDSAGIVSNLFSESHLNPFSVGDGGAAFGIGQWHKDRQDNYTKTFGHTMQSVTDAKKAFQEQMKFVDWELHNTEKNAYDKMESASGAYGKGAAISKFYERPSAVDEAANNRGNTAVQIAGLANQTAQVRGDIKVSIDHNGGPNTKVAAAATGNAFATAPTVNNGLPMAQVP